MPRAIPLRYLQHVRLMGCTCIPCRYDRATGIHGISMIIPYPKVGDPLISEIFVECRIHPGSIVAVFGELVSMMACLSVFYDEHCLHSASGV